MTVIEQQTMSRGMYMPYSHRHEGIHHSKGPPKRSFSIWLATHITAWVGTIFFFVAVFGLTTIWLVWNAFGPKQWRFDPAPAYVLWLFISNLIQLMLLPLLMISQQLQTRVSEQRVEAILEYAMQLHLASERLEARQEELALTIQAIEGRLDEMMQLARRLEAGERLRHQQAAHDASASLPPR